VDGSAVQAAHEAVAAGKELAAEEAERRCSKLRDDATRLQRIRLIKDFDATLVPGSISRNQCSFTGESRTSLTGIIHCWAVWTADQETRLAELQEEDQHAQEELLVMVRTYNPMPGMLARMREFSDDLYTNLPHAQFMVSVDATHYNRTSEISSAVPKAIVQDYTWDDVLSGYPVLSEMTIASAYDFHMEPILLAVNYSRTHARTSQNASFG